MAASETVVGTIYLLIGGFGSVAMSNLGDEYTGTIPAGSNGDVVDYYVSATDNDAQTTTNPRNMGTDRVPRANSRTM